MAGVVGARWCGSSRGCDLRGLRVGRRRSVFFDGHAKFVKLAVVLGVLRRDAFGNGLRALELRAGIEKAALLTAMKLELALGTLAVGIKTCGQNGAAVGAAAARDGADHARSARAELIRARTALRGLAIVPFFPLFAFFRVSITAVTVLSIHTNLRPGTTPDYNGNQLDFHKHAHSKRGMYPTGLLHSAHSAIDTQKFRTGLATSKQEMGQLCF